MCVSAACAATAKKTEWPPPTWRSSSDPRWWDLRRTRWRPCWTSSSKISWSRFLSRRTKRCARLRVPQIAAAELLRGSNFFVPFLFLCAHRSSVLHRRTAPPHLCLPHVSPRGSGNPSPSPSGPLVFIHLWVTTTFSTQRVIILLLWLDCHLHPHHYPILFLLNVQEIIIIIKSIFFLFIPDKFRSRHVSRVIPSNS